MSDEIAKAAAIQLDSRRIGAGFLKTELDVSLTFAKAALSAGNNHEKRERDRVNARKGYDTLIRLGRKFEVAPSETEAFAERLETLKVMLKELGETELD